MRDQLQVRSFDVPNESLIVTIPGHLVRLVAVRGSIDNNLVGERVVLNFSIGGTGSIAKVVSGPTSDVATFVTFVLGGATNDPYVISFDPVTGIYTYRSDREVSGPLPDMWLSGDLPVEIGLESAGGTLTTTELLIVREIKKEEKRR